MRMYVLSTLSSANKVPILIFSGHIDGTVLKWERLQLNTFLYSQEQFTYKDKLMESLQKEKAELTGGHPLIGSDPKQGILEKLYEEKVKRALQVSIVYVSNVNTYCTYVYTIHVICT